MHPVRTGQYAVRGIGHRGRPLPLPSWLHRLTMPSDSACCADLYMGVNYWGAASTEKPLFPLDDCAFVANAQRQSLDMPTKHTTTPITPDERPQCNTIPYLEHVHILSLGDDVFPRLGPPSPVALLLLLLLLGGAGAQRVAQRQRQLFGRTTGGEACMAVSRKRGSAHLPSTSHGAHELFTTGQPDGAS